MSSDERMHRKQCGARLKELRIQHGLTQEELAWQIHTTASNGRPLSGTQWQQLWKYIDTRTVQEQKYYRYVDGVRTVTIVNPKSSSPPLRQIIHRGFVHNYL